MKRFFPLLVLSSQPAFALDLGGVSVQENIMHDGQKLTLNGAGIRKKFMFKVYVGALYLTEKNASAEAILASNGQKLIKLHFLRDVDKGKIADAWREGFEANCAAECETFRADLQRLTALADDMKDKETMAFAIAPDKVSYFKNEVKKSELERKGFGRIVLSIFLGAKPADADLKNSMLGGQ